VIYKDVGRLIKLCFTAVVSDGF